MKYPKQRELDGVYFRVQRDGKWNNICFSDLTDGEKQNVLDGKTDEWLRSMCVMLSNVIRCIGDELDLIGDYDD